MSCPAHPTFGWTATCTRLKPGDGVGFKAGDGLAHTFINNSDSSDVEVLVVGLISAAQRQPDFYPRNPEQKAGPRGVGGTMPSQRALGPHDGVSNRRRGETG